MYHATQESLGRAVALKVVRDDDAGAGEMRSHERFVLEAEILARLQHPNIVSIIDFGTMEGPFAGQSFIAMELLGGETLAQRLKGGKRLPVTEVLSMAGQIARALRAAHERGIVHRDLKPSNIILVPDADGEEIVKLVDFGIGKLLWDGKTEQRADLTGVGGVVGTPQFIAPEQIAGETLAAADLYSLGAIMFLALSGRLPFDAATTVETLKSKLSHVAPRLQDVAPEVEIRADVASLVASLLARAPEERPTTSAVARAIAACAGRPPPGSEASTELCPPTAPASASARVDVAVAASFEKATSASLLPPATSSATSSRPSAVAAGPEASDRMRRVAKLTPVVVGALMTYAIVLVYAFGQRDPGLHEEPGAVPGATPARIGTSSPEHGGAGPRSTTARATFTVVVDSVPAGATVTEDGRALGTTPLALSTEKASVAPAARRFVVQRSGYAPVTVEPGPLREDTHMVVALSRVAQPIAPPRSTVAAGAAPASAPAASVTPASTPSPAASMLAAPIVQEFSTGK